MDMKLVEHSLILNKILNEDLLLNNANVALLQEFVRSWINSAVRGNTFGEILQNWLKRVEQLHLQERLNDGTCIVTIFILEVWLNSIDLDQDSRYDALLSRTFVHFHNIIVSACLKNNNEITSNNDAVIAFFRLHRGLSKTVKGVELIRKYNLWKPLLSFYFQNNRFNLFIQNLCTEYINNLLSAELPNELFSFLEVLNMSIQCIKTAIEHGHPLCDGVLFRSLRFVHLLLSKNLAKLDADSLRLTSKRCLSLESYVRRLLILSKDETIVCNSLKIFVLLRIFLAVDAENDDKLFQRLIATLHQLLTENERFNHYVPEIFRSRTEFAGESVRWKLGVYSAYLQVRTVSEYLTQLDVSTTELMDLDPLIPESEIFNNFFELYFAQLRKQNQVATIATNILKNLQDDKNWLDQDTRIRIIRSFSRILKLILNDARKPSEELSNFLRNVVHAISALVAAKAELIKNETMFSELLGTLMQITLADQQYSVLVRLSVFKLCSLILRKLGKIADENKNLIRVVVVQGLNSPCWEIRDTVLEILCEILPVLFASSTEFLLADNEVSKSLLERLQDEESFVRASAYAILITSISLGDRHTRKIYFDYNSLLEETTQRFQSETEGNVREKMIDFFIKGWREIKISDSSLLRTIYQTIHTASVNDLHPEVRRNGMTFWKNLIRIATCDHDDQRGRSVEDILEKLFFTGCLQAVVSGVEDEYDEQVRDTALEALQILKSVKRSVNATGNGSTTVSRNVRLLNELLAMTAEADVLNARQFISNITATSFDYPTLERPTETGELDLSDLLKCFFISDEGAEVNQKDCY